MLLFTLVTRKFPILPWKYGIFVKTKGQFKPLIFKLIMLSIIRMLLIYDEYCLIKSHKHTFTYTKISNILPPLPKLNQCKICSHFNFNELDSTINYPPGCLNMQAAIMRYSYFQGAIRRELFFLNAQHLFAVTCLPAQNIHYILISRRENVSLCKVFLLLNLVIALRLQDSICVLRFCRLQTNTDMYNVNISSCQLETISVG